MTPTVGPPGYEIYISKLEDAFSVALNKYKLTELLGLTAIYSITVGSSNRLLGPSSSRLFLNRMEDPTNMHVLVHIGSVFNVLYT